MENQIEQLNQKKWFRLLRVIYVALIISAITTIAYEKYSDTQLFLWGELFQTVLLWTIAIILVMHGLKRIFYYVHLGKFIPERRKNIFSKLEVVVLLLFLIALIVNWVTWRPHKIRIQCHLKTTGTIQNTENFDEKYKEQYKEYLKCLNKHGLKEYPSEKK